MTTPTTKGQSTDPSDLAPNPEEVNNFHRYADTDVSPDALHHTTGKDPNQASPGDHTHDGRSSPLLTGFTPTTGAGSAVKAIQGTDDRNNNLTPAQWEALITGWIGDEGRSVSGMEFKAGSTIGLPSGYYGVITYSPWGDDTGGGIHQIAFGNGHAAGTYDGTNLSIDEGETVWKRYGLRSGAWGPWRRLGESRVRKSFSVSALTFVAQSTRVAIHCYIEVLASQSGGSLDLTLTGFTGTPLAEGAFMNSNVWTVGVDRAGTRLVSTTVTRYFRTNIGVTYTLTPSNFVGTLNKIEGMIVD